VAASNDVGLSNYSSVSEQVQTDQAAPDSPPVIISSTPVTSSSVILAWTPPDQSTWNGPLTGYLVVYRDEDGGTDWQTVSVAPTDTQCIVGNLILFTTYEVRMSALNAKGRSDYGLLFTFYMEIAPTACVQDVKVRLGGVEQRS